MKLEELKYDMPETPDFIHNMIQAEVARQVRPAKVISLHERRKPRRSMRRAAVIAAACLAATSTAAYAGTKLYHMVMDRRGTYGVTTGITADAEKDALKLPKQIHEITITSGAIPEGMEWTEEGSLLSRIGHPYEGGISIAEVLLDSDDLRAAKLDTHVVESEEHTFGAYEGIYLRYDTVGEKNTFNQRIYMICPEFYRVLTIDVSADVTKEEAIRFAEELVITETDEMIDTKGLYTWSEIVHPEILTGDPAVTTGIPGIHSIGETFSLKSVPYEDAEGKFHDTDAVTACLESVQIADDLELLQNAHIPGEWKAAVDGEGHLITNHLSYIRQGDGVQALNQVVKEEDVAQKLVYTTVTYTNTSTEEMRNLLYMGTLMSLRPLADGSYEVYLAEETPGDDYDYIACDSVARTQEMGYFDVRGGDGDGGNYLSSLKPGESVTVHMAWIVNETDLENLYLNLNGTGLSTSFDASTLETGLVSLGR